MDWMPPALFGFALGLVGTLVTVRVERSWRERDDTAYNDKILQSLLVEIDEGLRRAKYLAKIRAEHKDSMSRIYTALWQSTNQRLAGTLPDSETIALLHRIYHRFDLINFNFELQRPGPAAAFAAQYVPEIEENLNALKLRLKKA